MSIDYIININTLNSSKKNIVLKANDKDMDYLAKEISVLRIKQIDVNLEASKEKDAIIVIKGYIEAILIQECVVSLEELQSSMKIEIDRRYAMQDKYKVKKMSNTIDINVNDEEIEILGSGKISIMEIVREELLLEQNIFPKKEEFY